MNVTVPIALFGWIPVVLLLFSVMPARRAVLTAFLAGTLFLPVAGYHLPGLPEYSKSTAMSYSVLLGVVLLDPRRLLAWRPGPIDLFMGISCLVPMASSLSNELGPYDGMSAVVHQTLIWGVPYFIGRMYFQDLASHRELAVGVVAGGLVYLPLCLYEIRMSPQLHTTVYGFFQHSFDQTFRFGGWRPTVFMQHPLMVAAWMMSASVVAVWLWVSGSVRRVFGVPLGWALGPLLVTAVLCKSLGSLVLLAIGLGSMAVVRWLRMPIVLVVVATLPLVYIAARLEGSWSGASLVSLVESVSKERAESFNFRVVNEQRLLKRAMERPVFGWGGWGRSRIYDEEEGKDVSVTDGLWIIALGTTGLVGLTALYGWLLVPPAVAVLRLRRAALPWAVSGPALALATIALLFAWDTIPNAVVNPVFLLCSGGVASLGQTLARWRRPQTAPIARPGGVPSAGLVSPVPSGPEGAAPGAAQVSKQ